MILRGFSTMMEIGWTNILYICSGIISYRLPHLETSFLYIINLVIKIFCCAILSRDTCIDSFIEAAARRIYSEVVFVLLEHLDVVVR